MNGKNAASMRITLQELGHPQPPTCNNGDNKTAKGILTREVRQKLSKAFNMPYYWMRDRIKQKQFVLKWEKGTINMADYFTKHHPPWHHKKTVPGLAALVQDISAQRCVTSLEVNRPLSPH